LLERLYKEEGKRGRVIEGDCWCYPSWQLEEARKDAADEDGK
jgi:hypothetical protein